MAKQITSKKKANKKPAAKSSAKVKDTPAVKSDVASASVEQPEVTSAPSKKPKTTVVRTPVSRLLRWYKWLGIITFVAGLVVVVLGNKTAAPITAQYPAADALASEASGHQVIALASRHIGDMPIAWAVALFLLAFSVVCVMVTMFCRYYLEASLQRGVNAFRWMALSVTGGLMVVTIALVSGFSALPLLLALFVLNCIGGMLAFGAEIQVANNNGVKTRFAHALCSLAVVSASVPWVVFGLSLLGKFLWHGYFTSYLYSIYVCQFALFVAILLATHYRLKRQGRWADAFYTDRGFLILGFVAAALLAVQVFVGVLK